MTNCVSPKNRTHTLIKQSFLYAEAKKKEFFVGVDTGDPGILENIIIHKHSLICGKKLKLTLS